MDLLEDAGIPPPKPPIITDDDRAALASMALAQRQFYYVSTFFAGMVVGATVAYFIGYNDLVLTIVKWTLSGTGLALIERSVREQLGGTVTMDFAQAGLTCVISLPVRANAHGAPVMTAPAEP